MTSFEIRNQYDLRTTSFRNASELSRIGYKFFSNVYADSYFSKGELRIGTLKKFRSHENCEIEDPLEGSWSGFGPGRLCSLRELGIGVPDAGPFSAVIKPESANSDLDAPRVVLSGFEVRVMLPDYYIFCYCRSYDLDVACSLSGYDRVAKISNIYKLADFIVTQVDPFIGYSYFIVEMVYATRAKDVSQVHQPRIEALVEKDLRFSKNKECRIYFVPPGDARRSDLEPRIIRHPGLTNFFSKIVHPISGL